MEIKTFLDRIEDGKAVLMDEEERQAVIPAEWLSDLHEGMAVDITIIEDPEREAAARKEAADLLQDIRRQ